MTTNVTTKTNPTYAPTRSRLSWRGIVGVILLALVGYLLYGYWQGEKAEPTTDTGVEVASKPEALTKAEDSLIGNTVTIAMIDDGCTVACSNQFELTVTNSHNGYVWLTDSEGDTVRCLPSVLTPGRLHPMPEVQNIANDGPHPGVPITFDGRSHKARQVQTNVMDEAHCEFAYTDMLYRGRQGLQTSLSQNEQNQLDEGERYCYNHPGDAACNLGRSARGWVDGLIDGVQN